MSGNEWSGTEDVEAAVAGGDLVLAPRVTVFARLRSDAGMTTAEYAVGTVAACGVGGVLVKVLTSESFSSLLWKVIEKAFSIIFLGPAMKRQRGAATLEMAFAVPALVGIACLLTGLVLVGVRQVEAVDVARGYARDIARGDHDHASLWRGQLPPGSDVRVEVRDGLARVEVREVVRINAPVLRSFRIPLSAHASARIEEGATG